MERYRLVIATIWAVVALILALPAEANLITNGDFESGDLTGWTAYTTVDGTIGQALGLPDVISFDTTGGGPSDAARFQVGRVTLTAGSREGGGVFQDFASGAGPISIAVDIAVDEILFGRNGDGGIFNLMLDGAIVASHDFGVVTRSTPTDGVHRSTLAFSDDITAGIHELRIEMDRKFGAGGTSGLTPLQFIDNVVVNGPEANIPEPGSLVLLWLGLAGLGAFRRRIVQRYKPRTGS